MIRAVSLILFRKDFLVKIISCAKRFNRALIAHIMLLSIDFEEYVITFNTLLDTPLKI